MWASSARIYAVALKEIKQLSRDRVTFAMIVMIPLVQLILFGYAINTDARHIPAGVVDYTQNQTSRALILAIEATQAVNFQHHYYSPQEATDAIIRGDIKAVLILPHDLERRIALRSNRLTQDSARLLNEPIGQWLVDGSDTLIAATVRSLRTMPLNDVTQSALPQTPVTFEVVQWFNPEQRSVVNIVPGLLAIILTMTMILFTSAAIVREREQGNMEFLINTPIRPFELMLGKITPYVFAGLIQVSIILLVGHLLFSVPIRGGLLSLFGAALLFIFASLTLGLVISTIAKTQLQAMQLTVFILLPSILLSGFMFPYQAMPEPAQWIAEGLPATHFIRMVRAIVLREADFLVLQQDALWLVAFTLLGILLASVRFKKKLS
ncbi:ABC transporter permease [Marinomonas fungiae]|uniref:ABC-type multidrug transport system, permease component n=1 Tax=Marinomonas fungiae TaxID=1137284 RepID=A0A0K6IQN4_9GAMM|nr:ABC transporter permease [Marinomonas fungiae]CUB05404.1 ABC-type multidrug transport system, permease component [Marinomonas fungiae]